MKNVKWILALALAAGMMISPKAMAAPENWAYAGLDLQSEEAGVGCIYYSAPYFDQEGIVNPVTAEAYTEEELAQIKDGAAEENEAYITAPEGAYLGLGVFGSEEICWYDEEGAAAITSHADPLALDKETGSVFDGEGKEIAQAMIWAYAGLDLQSEEAGVGTIYYTKKYFETEGRINPVTQKPYTEEELTALQEDVSTYPLAPSLAYVGMQVYGEETIYWYGEEAAAAIVSHADPLALDAESGDMLDGEGLVVASPL